MDVHLRVQYLTGDTPQMRPDDYNATLLVHAIKGKEISPSQYAKVKIDGRLVTIRDENKDRALEWFAEWAAPIVENVSEGRKVLVPIPNRRSFLRSGVVPRTASMATAICEHLGKDAVLADVLRWRRELPKSSDAASRRPELLLPELVLTDAIPWGSIVMVDDVFTSGGHAIAAAWRMEDQKRTPSALVCCGRTTWQQMDDPFAVPDETLEIPKRPRS